LDELKLSECFIVKARRRSKGEWFDKRVCQWCHSPTTLGALLQLKLMDYICFVGGCGGVRRRRRRGRRRSRSRSRSREWEGGWLEKCLVLYFFGSSNPGLTVGGRNGLLGPTTKITCLQIAPIVAFFTLVFLFALCVSRCCCLVLMSFSEENILPSKPISTLATTIPPPPPPPPPPQPRLLFL